MPKFCNSPLFFVQNFGTFRQKNEIAELCKRVHCVDLDESFQTHIYLQNLVLIQPRTSPVKFVLAERGRQRTRYKNVLELPGHVLRERSHIRRNASVTYLAFNLSTDVPIVSQDFLQSLLRWILAAHPTTEPLNTNKRAFMRFGRLPLPLGGDRSVKIKSLGAAKIMRGKWLSQLQSVRSRLYRSRFLQVNIRWKALDEIYKI